MSGYKRVSFYDLCRLCASNTQKEKTHIFQEEGRKIQLQNKIQTCLALTVNENDFLPKVVCSKCLRSLETCFGFRQECVRSESMLSTYFKNFRYTDDFKKSGKVYIKDNKPTPPPTVPQNSEVSSSTTALSTPQAVPQNLIQINKSHLQQPGDSVPFYTLQLPIVSNSSIITKIPKDLAENKITPATSNQFACNLNLLNTANVRTNIPKNELLSNVVVNSNGEVINIANMTDFEALINQGNNNTVRTKHKSSKHKESRVDSNIQESGIVKIDLTGSPIYDIEQNNIKYEKLPHIKSTQNQNKYSYSTKTEDKNQNPTVIFSNSEYNQNFNNNYVANNTIYTQSNMNVMNSTSHTTSHSNVTCNNLPTNDTSTLNINALRSVENSSLGINIINPNIQEVPLTTYTNVVSNVPTTSFNGIADNSEKLNIHLTDNNNTVNASNPQQKTHVCDICARAFKRREHLYQHMKLHTGFRPYICEQCNKAFMRKEHLIRHSTLHSGQKNYTCNICEKSFSRNDNLLKHRKTHDKQASYTCEICQKQFVMKHYYNAHKLTHGDKCFVSAVWNMLKT